MAKYADTVCYVSFFGDVCPLAKSVPLGTPMIHAAKHTLVALPTPLATSPACVFFFLWCSEYHSQHAHMKRMKSFSGKAA